MKFKSKTALAQHIKELEESGYLESKWILKHYEKDGKPMTKGTKMFKINFNSITSKGNES